ncbi:MAG: ABC transporter substrate-binding protein [Dehalococcoidia bacterium]|nr:ABC transporter substrate-binding protein [Dehalococcoidia bacterium]
MTLKYGSTGLTADAGVFVAIEKGFFREQGIDQRVENFRAIAEMAGPLATGELDVVGQPVDMALLNAADRGVSFKIVADRGQSRPNWEFMWILLRKDLADSRQVKTPTDLKGMKVATPAKGVLGEQVVQMMLAEANLSPKDIETVYMPFADQAAAFGNKAIAAAFAVDPFIARGVQEGFSAKWLPASKYFGGKVQSGFIIFGAKMAKDKDLGQRWMLAYLKGVRASLDAFSKREGRSEVVSILAKYTALKDPKLYDVMEMPYLDPDAALDSASVDLQHKWIMDQGIYTGKKTFEDLMDLSFAEYAAKKLGKWKE